MSAVLEIRKVKATRKRWQCDGCARWFEPGGPKERQRIIGDDGPYVWESCVTCSCISSELWAGGFCADEGVTPDDIYECMKQNYGSWDAADAHFEKETPKCLT